MPTAVILSPSGGQAWPGNMPAAAILSPTVMLVQIRSPEGNLRGIGSLVLRAAGLYSMSGRYGGEFLQAESSAFI